MYQTPLNCISMRIDCTESELSTGAVHKSTDVLEDKSKDTEEEEEEGEEEAERERTKEKQNTKLHLLHV